MSEAIAEPTQEPIPTPAQEPAPAASWRDGFENHPALSDFPDAPEEALQEVAKSFLATKEMVGRRGVILPKEGDDTDQSRFFNELGRPETADGYELSGFEPPEGLPWDDGMQSEMLSVLHDAGLNNSQVMKVLSGYAEKQVGQYSELKGLVERNREEALTDLRTELGTNFDSSISLSKQAFRSAAGERFEEVAGLALADGTMLGDHPAIIRTFINIGKQYAEHGIAGDKGGVSFTKSPETAQQEIAEIEGNPALYDADSPEHAMLVSKRDDLYKQAFPEAQPEVLR